jgi:hypothetical protein
LTSSQGTCALDGLPAGRYSISFSKDGFAEELFDHVDHVVGHGRTLNARLSLARGAAKTTVTEPLVQLDTNSAAVGAPIEQKQIEELPLNGRNWATLTTLAPGAIDTGAGDQRTIRFAGHGLDDNEVLYDGVDATGILNQAQKEYVRLSIPLDSISQFQVKSQNFGSEVGMSAGGQVAVASPSGTNGFHGGGFDYLRNNVLDSRSPSTGLRPRRFSPLIRPAHPRHPRTLSRSGTMLAVERYRDRALRTSRERHHQPQQWRRARRLCFVRSGTAQSRAGSFPDPAKRADFQQLD